MTSDPSFLEPLVRSVQDVFQLREDILQNLSDHELRYRKESPVRFNYLVDTQILTLYARPDHWAKTLSALPSLRGIDIEEDESIQIDTSSDYSEYNYTIESQTTLEANAFLTGEFIFSQALVGNGRRVLVAPEHVPEVMNYIAGFEGGAVRLVRDAEVGPDPYAQLRHRLQILRLLNETDSLAPAEVLDRMRVELVQGLAGISQTELLAAHRLNLLFRRDLMGNAAGQSGFTSDVISPPALTVRGWIERIKEVKSRPARPRALEADAVTLAQLASLNLDWREKGEVYVLITNDMALRAAYLRWMRTENARGRSHFFPLRSSRQYVPILNINEMGGAFEESQFFAEITQAVSTVITTFHSHDFQGGWWSDSPYRAPPRSAIRRVLDAQFDGSVGDVGVRARVLGDQFQEILQIWTGALEYAATAKADTVKDLITDHLEYWRTLLRGNELHSAFREEVRNLARGFDQLATASILLRYELRALEASSLRDPHGTVDLHGRREVASEFRAFTSPGFEGLGIGDLVEAIAQMANSAVEFVSAAQTDERLLVMGALCLEIGAWSAAEGLLEQSEAALKIPRDDRSAGLTGEVKFLRCVARRLATDRRNWRTEHEESRKVLDVLARQDAAPLEAARAHGERFALLLCAVAWAVPDRTARVSLRASYDEWSAFTQRFARSPLHEDEPPKAWACVRHQFELNTMVLAFWWHVLEPRMDARLRVVATETLALYSGEENRRGEGSQHGSIYPALARYALFEGQRREIVSKLITEIDAILDRDSRGGFAFDIPNVDREEYLRIREILQSRRK